MLLPLPVPAGLQHGVCVKAAFAAPGGVAAEEAAAQVVAADLLVGDAAGEAADMHVAVELADVEAGAPVRVCPQVGAGLEAALAATAVRTDGAALADVRVGADRAAPGAPLAARTIAGALVQVAEHGQASLAQLLRQRSEERDLGAVGGQFHELQGGSRGSGCRRSRRSGRSG
jgi:hypothetical protein